MTTSRFPARRAGTLVCGHPIACMYRWRDSKGTHKYCLACLLESSGIKDIEALTEEYKKEENKIETKSTIKKNSMEDFEKPGVTIDRLGETPKGGKKPTKKNKLADENFY